MRIFLSLLCLLSLPLGASAAVTSLPLCAGEGPVAEPITEALNHVLSFEYIRHPLDQWEEEGNQLCAHGVVLDRNIYRYNRVYLQIEVRRADGSQVAIIPLLFQMASIQAHHNSNQRPWTVLPWAAVAQQLRQVAPTQLTPTRVALPAPTDPNFVAAAKATNWAAHAHMDPETFAAMDMSELTGRPGLYLATWLEVVPNTGGSVFTLQYAAQALWLERQADGSWNYAITSGYRDLLAPLDTLLVGTAKDDNGNVEKRVARLRELSAPLAPAQ